MGEVTTKVLRIVRTMIVIKSVSMYFKMVDLPNERKVIFLPIT